MRILIAEDDPTSRALLSEVLGKFGHDVVETENGFQAWDAMQQADSPRVAILDWMMPGMDGLEVCRRIRRRGGDSYAYIIVLTAKGMRGDIEAGFEAGADDYLIKPLIIDDLKQRLRVAQRILTSEDRQAEARRQLAILAAEMQQLAEERARQLVHADRLATLGTLSAGIAHEINNPATFIAGNAQTIERAWSVVAPHIVNSGNDEQISMIVQEFPHMVKGIREGVSRISKIVDGLKTYSRQGAMNKQRFSVADAVDACLTLCHNLLKNRVKVVRRIPEDLPPAYGDIRQIEQVLTNLLTNAADALSGRADPCLCIEAGMSGKKIRLAVTDNGPGMKPESIARVFDPFFTTKEEGKGTGLGLPISKGIIEAHGGTMDAWNISEGGAQFSFTLPIAAAENQEDM